MLSHRNSGLVTAVHRPGLTQLQRVTESGFHTRGGGAAQDKCSPGAEGPGWKPRQGSLKAEPTEETGKTSQRRGRRALKAWEVQEEEEVHAITCWRDARQTRNRKVSVQVSESQVVRSFHGLEQNLVLEA